MSLVLQELLVTLLVAGCVLYSTWRLLPARLRLRCLDLVAALPGAHGARWHARLRERLRVQGGCGGCAGAAGHATKSRTP